MAQDSVYGIWTCSWLGCQGFNLWWGRGFFLCQKPPRLGLRPTQLPPLGTRPVTWGKAGGA